MTSPIGGMSHLQTLLPSAPASPSTGGAGVENGVSFQKLLLQSIEQVSANEQAAQTAALESFTGSDVSQVKALSDMKQADLALRMMLQIRNKVLEAYNEVKQMNM